MGNAMQNTVNGPVCDAWGWATGKSDVAAKAHLTALRRAIVSVVSAWVCSVCACVRIEADGAEIGEPSNGVRFSQWPGCDLVAPRVPWATRGSCCVA